ncbi:hypothetical protein L9F63_001137 [Diploptera punctata]|uniref:Uncharacterized protein n=1 Tax=Diploptera punctata TaxID=6984 RepID=A0AAD8EJZ6_DIPPU|nr:hypothetical protein L9F63_001137 [Diploptera punctata]
MEVNVDKMPIWHLGKENKFNSKVMPSNINLANYQQSVNSEVSVKSNSNHQLADKEKMDISSQDGEDKSEDQRVLPPLLLNSLLPVGNQYSYFDGNFNSYESSIKIDSPKELESHRNIFFKDLDSSNCFRDSSGNLKCISDGNQPKRKRVITSSSSSEIDSEFAHIPKTALEFLSYGPTSCPSSLNEPITHHVNFHIFNSLPLLPYWLSYQPEVPLGGCPTTLMPHINPLRVWPRSLLVAKCVCDGSRCSFNGSHRCITVRSVVVSLVREKGNSSLKRFTEIVSVGCICAEQKSILIQEHRASIVV